MHHVKTFRRCPVSPGADQDPNGSSPLPPFSTPPPTGQAQDLPPTVPQAPGGRRLAELGVGAYARAHPPSHAPCDVPGAAETAKRAVHAPQAMHVASEPGSSELRGHGEAPSAGQAQEQAPRGRGL